MCVVSSKSIYSCLYLLGHEKWRRCFPFFCSWREPIPLKKTPFSLFCTWYRWNNSWCSVGSVHVTSDLLLGGDILQRVDIRPSRGYLAAVISVCDITHLTELPLCAREAVDGLYRYGNAHTVLKQWFGFILMSCVGAKRLDLSTYSVRLCPTLGWKFLTALQMAFWCLVSSWFCVSWKDLLKYFWLKSPSQ